MTTPHPSTGGVWGCDRHAAVCGAGAVPDMSQVAEIEGGASARPPSTSGGVSVPPVRPGVPPPSLPKPLFLLPLPYLSYLKRVIWEQNRENSSPTPWRGAAACGENVREGPARWDRSDRPMFSRA